MFVEPGVDVDVDMPSSQSEVERLEGLLAHLQDFPPDDGVEDLRARYRERLGNLTKVISARSRDPTVQLLRAQRLTRKRESQRDAANSKLAALESEVVELQGRLADARTVVEQAGDAVAEAKLQEQGFRINLALAESPSSKSEPDAALSEVVSDLQAQVDALPAAFRSGNMESAHAAIREQLSIVAEKLRAPEIQAPSNVGPAEKGDAGAQQHFRVDNTSTAAEQFDRHANETIGTQRSVNDPDKRPRSRSRNAESAWRSDQEGKLRRAAEQLGQRRIRSWLTAARGGSCG